MKYFGTDGIRGLNEIFTEGFLKKIASATVKLFGKNSPIAIARDTRVSGRFIEETLARFLTDYGANVILLDITATPVCAYATKVLKCSAGIMISASHNPPEYNGIKFFGGNGAKLPSEAELERLIDCEEEIISEKGEISHADADTLYIEYILEKLGEDKPLEGLKVLLDTANGACAFVAPRLFNALGATVTVIANDTSGLWINENCGATHWENLVSAMDEGDYDIGFTYDGDGDRVMAVKCGKVFDGDHIIFVLAKHLKMNKKEEVGTVVGTVMTNYGAEKAFKQIGVNFLRAKVGDKYVYQEMCKLNSEIGGEASGHIILRKYQETGDGLLASAVVALTDKESDILMLDDIKEYPQISKDIMTTPQKVIKFNESEEIAKYLEEIKDKINGRAVVRASGTEPRIRIMVETACESEAEKTALEIRNRILKEIED
ncbi:MAG: phosphoglucosamine mutase [Firmicutes bacterium]|nr:phosphoglucosamine mutase [Bacillota bacterium]